MNTAGLLPYQIAPASELLSILARNGGALDGSDMGTGKTFVAGAVIRELNCSTLVVCPQISITAWKRCGVYLGVEFDVLNYEMLRTGNTSYGAWENPRPKKLPRYLECTQCQLKIEPEKPFRCPHHHQGVHCVRERVAPFDLGKFIWSESIELLVFDECHRCGSMDSFNADMLSAAKRQGIKTLALSATVADSPLNFKALGYVLGLHGLIDRNGGETPGFYRWANRMGCRKSHFGGLAFMGNETHRRIKMAELHSQIFEGPSSRGVRVRIAELPKGAFPDVQIRAELYDLKESGRIDELYREMDDAVQELNQLKARDANLEHPLTRLLRARQEVELLKVPIFEELVAQGLENGRTVGVFVNFTATIEELAKRLKTDCRIDGTQVGEAGHLRRQQIIDRIQSDQERVILLNNQAGGVSISLHDVTGTFPRLGLVSLPNSASMFRQLCGRFPRAGGKSPSLYRVVLAAGTVEEKQHKRLVEKLNNLDILNDGDLNVANLPLSKHLLDEIFSACDDGSN